MAGRKGIDLFFTLQSFRQSFGSGRVNILSQLDSGSMFSGHRREKLGF